MADGTRRPVGEAAIAAVTRLARGVSAPAGMSAGVLAIDGPGGAGKSTLAARVSARLGGAFIVHTDDFAAPDVPVDWWPRLRDQVLAPLRDGAVARYQRYDWDVGELAEWIAIPHGDVVIVEGVTAARREFRPFLAASVWVDCDRAERLRRGLQRDGESAREHWRAWQAAEDAHFAADRPDLTADLIVSGERGTPWPGPHRPDKPA